MARDRTDAGGAGADLESAMRLDMVFISHAVVGPDWNGEQCPVSGPNRVFHLAASGRARVEAGGKRLSLVPGHVYYIPTDLPTRRTCPSRYESFYGMFTCRDIGGRDLLKEYRYPLDIGAWDRRLLGHDEGKARLVSRRLYARSVILAGLIARYPGLRDKLDGRSGECARFRDCLNFIRENLSAELTVGELARMEGLSRNAFTRAFKSATGATPRAYLASELNQQACRMVLTSGMTIREIGRELGFSDEYYFNRFFKKMNGLPPLRYRRSML